MGAIDNLRGGDPFEAIWKELRALRSAANANSTAIGAGGIRVHSGGGITIENGGLSVTGSATIIGTLNADGTINMTGVFIAEGEMRLNGSTIATGDFTIVGPLLVDGETTFNGELTISGITNLNGDTTLTGDFTVEGEGKIVAGETTIRPSGTINFGETLTISPASELGPASISDGFAKYILTPDGGDYFHQFQGGAYIDGKISGHGGLKITDLPTTSQPANLYMDPVTGVVKRSTA